MLTQVAIVPSAPLLVPELAGPDSVEVDEVRRAVLSAGRSLGAAATRWTAVGAAGVYRRFAAYGVDVPVSLRPSDDAAALPLSMLIAAWLRGAAAPTASVEPFLVDSDGPDAAVVDRLVRRLDGDPDPVGLLIVGDGATALSPSAPGGGDRESAHILQATIDAALGGADLDTLAGLDPAACAAEGVSGDAAWRTLAAVARGRDILARPRYAGAPFGVGYTVATWTVR